MCFRLNFRNVLHVRLHMVSHLSCLFQCPSGVRSTAGLEDRMSAPVWLESPSETHTHRHVATYHKHVSISLYLEGKDSFMFHPYIMWFPSTLSEAAAAAASCLPHVEQAAGETCSHTWSPKKSQAFLSNHICLCIRVCVEGEVPMLLLADSI